MRVRVVVSCTNRKSAEPHADARFRTVPPGMSKQRAEVWLSRLANKTERFPARELYSGDHWSVADSIPQTAAKHGFGAEVWVVSAGLGLLGREQLVPAYSATFSINDPDSVVPSGSGETGADWWNALVTQRKAPGPSSVRELAEAAPEAPLLLALSPTYLEPLERDILSAVDALESPDLMSIVCGGTLSTNSPLADLFVPVDARFQTLVGGSLVALNARVARYAVDNLGPGLSRPRISEKFAEILRELPERETFDRQQLDDNEVREFIEEKLAERPGMARTPMLRALRDSGRACEQGRFKQLYEEVAASQDDLNHSLV